MADITPATVDLQVSKELYVLFGMQERINKFLWTSEASYSYTLAHLAAADPDADAEIGLGVESRAWDRAASGRRHFEGSTGVFLSSLRENSNHIFGTVLVQYFAAFERYLISRRGAYRRRASEQGPWSPLISGCEHLSADRPYPVPLERLLLADTSRLLRNIVAHGDDVPPNPDDLRIATWKRRVEAVLSTTKWPGDHQAIVRDVAGQVFGRVARSAAKTNLPGIYFFMLYSFTNLSAMALAVEEALFDPASEEAFIVRRQAKYVRRLDLVIQPNESTQ